MPMQRVNLSTYLTEGKPGSMPKITVFHLTDRIQSQVLRENVLTSQKHAIDGYSDKDSFSVDRAIPPRLTWESSYYTLPAWQHWLQTPDWSLRWFWHRKMFLETKHLVPFPVYRPSENLGPTSKFVTGCDTGASWLTNQLNLVQQLILTFSVLWRIASLIDCCVTWDGTWNAYRKDRFNSGQVG